MRITGFYSYRKRSLMFDLDEKSVVRGGSFAVSLLTLTFTPDIISLLQEPIPCATISDRLNPIVDAIRSCAKPIALGSMCWGWSKVMLGQKHEGYKQIFAATWGFLGIQLAPTIMDYISGVGRII